MENLLPENGFRWFGLLLKGYWKLTFKANKKFPNLLLERNFLQQFSIIGVGLIGIVLRLIRLPLLTIWSDEYHTIRNVSMSFSQIFNGRLIGELNPPLYFGLLRFYLKIFGNSEISMRSFSVIFSVLSIILFYFLAKEILKDYIPVLGAVLIYCFHPMYLYYADEIRPYALLTFLGILSFLSFIKYINGPRHRSPWLIVLLFGLTLSLYTHHFGFLIIISVGLGLVINCIKTRSFQKFHIHVIFVILVTFLLYIPGLQTLIRQTQNYSTNIESLYEPSIFLNIFTFSIHQPWYEPIVLLLGLLALILGIGLLIVKRQFQFFGLFLGSAVLSTVLIALFIHQEKINLLPRYFLGVSPLVIIGIAGTLVSFRNHWIGKFISWLGFAITLLYIFYGIDFLTHTNQENFLAGWKADWKQVSVELKSRQLFGEPFLLTAWDQTPIQYYLNQTASPDILAIEQTPNLNSFLVVISPVSSQNLTFDNAHIIYEDKAESIRIMRVFINKSP